MQFCVIGLNHNTAPVNIREQFSIAPEKIPLVYGKIKEFFTEGFVISTCNRVEYYMVNCNIDEMYSFVSAISGIEKDILKKYSYSYTEKSAVRHLVKVASGIDSLILGEPQILGQVKDSFKNARKYGTVKTYMNKLEQFVLSAAKNIRTNTGIAENAVSVSYAAVSLAKKIFGNLTDKTALIVGAGEMCELAAEHLHGAGTGMIYITNRTAAKAEALALKFNGKVLPFENFTDYLFNADIVISSTGADFAVITLNDISKAIKKRKNEPMFLIDMAVPRDIESEVGNVDNIYLYNVDDLEQVVDSNSKERRKEAEKAMEIISDFVDSFDKHIKALSAVPLINEMKKLAGIINNYELEQFCKRNKITDEAEIAKLAYMLKSASNKLLHAPMVNIKHMAGEDEDAVEVAARLFDIKLFNSGKEDI